MRCKKLHTLFGIRGSTFKCQRCISSFSSPEALANHRKRCEKIVVANSKFPEESFLKLKNCFHKRLIYLKVRADFKCGVAKLFGIIDANTVEVKTRNGYKQNLECNGYCLVSVLDDVLKSGYYSSA